MEKHISVLADKSLLIIFAYAAAGLGHLRVTDALYHGLPKEVTPILLGTNDTSISILHRIMSVHTVTRNIMEWAQAGRPEKIFTKVYRKYLRSETDTLYRQMTDVLHQRIVVPKTILVVATHFGLAHQFAALKGRLEKEENVKLVLAVQVTDDSPQQMWYVDGADVIFTPSVYTRDALRFYGEQTGLPPVPFEVVAYPVSPLLGNSLTESQYKDRMNQLEAKRTNPIHVMIPVSGAAVGTLYFTKLIDTLHLSSERFIFHIVSKEAPFTNKFLKDIKSRVYVRLYTSSHDRNVVGIYESVYNDTVISLEITKPSEQAFKALLSPKQIGGSILLFSKPVGRQEYDNLNFLERHGRIPDRVKQQILSHVVGFESPAKTEDKDNILNDAKLYRGIRIPADPIEAANFIWTSLSRGIFSQMVRFVSPDVKKDSEVNTDGVHEFWRRVIKYLS